ncbi:LIC12162 family transferase [Sulfuritalea hydrogenivorans]|uniref:Transferase n=1 Tax=Sulfuritalea hydrogenivorans sk43H TaxID=1223802 RepID=W0SJ92_9PROT|nr:LIC12162 family protein [Sulfuritalea hydrogenivorans]BAO31137.1 hypothetical protein SUTH_03367 [Sulfuritalea hydrogenivorans sk43H]
MSSPSFVWDAEAVATGLEATSRLRPALLARLKRLLDEFHGVSRPIEYHDLVAGMWLENLTHNIYTAWREVLAGSIPADSDPIPIVKSTKHAQQMTVDIGWHRHLRGAVARLLEGGSAESWPVAQDSDYTSSGGRYRGVHKILRGISTGKPKVLLTQPYFKCSRQESMWTLWRWRNWIARDDMTYPISVAATANWNWRKRRSAELPTPPRNFEELVGTLLPLYIPIGLLEGFEDYREAVLSLPLPRPQAVYSANALHAHPTFQILMAEWRQEGTRLLYHQHGGGYGLDPQLVVENYEIRVSDRFYTWGWRRDGSFVHPLSPAMPSVKRKPSSGQILLNCLDLPRMPFRMTFAPMPGTIEIMHRNTCEFLMEYPDRSNLVVRPFNVDYGWGAVESMRAAAPEARFDKSLGPFAAYSSSRLVVHNYLGTAWLETLGLNIPTVVFYNPAAYVYRDETRAGIDALQRVGVLHHSGKDAARFIAGLGQDIEGWWRKPEVQVARHDFVQCYANFSPDWAKQWAREFEAVLDGAR